MARDILGEYGPESPMNQKPRASHGGQMPVRDVMGYRPPTGPTNINDPKGPGLHGHNCGPGGTQGPYPTHTDGNQGHPGIGGTNRGMGSNRRG
jgi:hypothetical protein